MKPALRPLLSDFARFVRTPTLGRRVAGMLALALILMLALNLAVFVLIQRTSDYNDRVEQAQQTRLLSREILTRLVDAETGQRGFLLTARPEYLSIHDEAMRDLPDLFQELDGLTLGDADLGPRIGRLSELSSQRMTLMQRSIVPGPHGPHRRSGLRSSAATRARR